MINTLNVSVLETVVVPESMVVLSVVLVLVVDDKSVLTVVRPVCMRIWEELDEVVVVE